MPKSIIFISTDIKKFWKYSLKLNCPSSRSEYWISLLVNYLIMFILYGLTYASSDIYQEILMSLSIIYSLLIIIPGVTIVCRRYVDSMHSYWYGLIWEFLRLILKCVYIGYIYQNHSQILNMIQSIFENSSLAGVPLIIKYSCTNFDIILLTLLIGIDIVNFVFMCAKSKRAKFNPRIRKLYYRWYR